jgi:hypothetical protein
MSRKNFATISFSPGLRGVCAGPSERVRAAAALTLLLFVGTFSL